MWGRVNQAFIQSANGRILWVLLSATTSVYLAIVLYSIPIVVAESPGTRLFDMSPTGYTADDASHLLTAIGETGRARYLNLQLPLDLVYPALFGVTYTLLLFWLFQKTCASGSLLFRLAWIPVLAGAFDYLENIGVYVMVTQYPLVSDPLVRASSICSVIKSGATVMVYVLLLMGAALWLRSRFGRVQEQ